MKNRIIIDTDIAMGIPERDVDDGLAIIMALNSKQIEVAAITLTWGNDSLENVSKSLKTLFDKGNFPNIETARGASSQDDLGKDTKATELIIKTLEKESATIVAIGPATNLASAIKIRPAITENIKEVIMVAARQPGQRFLTGNHSKGHPDLNFERDPEAVRILLDSDIPITFAPFEVSSKVWINQTVLDKVNSHETTISGYIYEQCLPWLKFWQETFSTPLYSINGFNPFDTLAIAWLTDRKLLNWRACDPSIETDDYDTTDNAVQGSGSGKKLYLHARFKKNNSSRYRYIFDLAREEFLESLISRLK